jgi:hypothetical protein
VKHINNAEGYISAPSLYQDMERKLRKASITLYKVAQREGLFSPSHYTIENGRLKYWFTPQGAEAAKAALLAHYKRKP